MRHQLLRMLRQSPRLKSLLHKLIFRRKPYSARVRWYVWLVTIFPRYFRRGVDWSSRLDLVPFHRFVLGRDARIEKNVVINNGMGDVVMGDEVHTGVGCVLIGPVTMEKHVGLSQYVRILGMHHGMDPDRPHHFQPCVAAPVILEEDVFVGTGAVIMGKKNGAPLVLGRYARVGANAVVMDDVPPYTVVVGNPARAVRRWSFTRKKWVQVDENASSPKDVSVDQSSPIIMNDPQ